MNVKIKSKTTKKLILQMQVKIIDTYTFKMFILILYLHIYAAGTRWQLA